MQGRKNSKLQFYWKGLLGDTPIHSLVHKLRLRKKLSIAIRGRSCGRKLKPLPDVAIDGKRRTTKR